MTTEKATSNIKLPLTSSERRQLRAHKIKKSDILNYEVSDLAEILSVHQARAQTLLALADFQRIPSIGIKFASKLIELGYFCIDDLKHEDGAALTDKYERLKGFQADPCVEDQFRLAVHFANHQDATKNWWDFTAARKQFRGQHGYPKDRPSRHWTADFYSNKS